MSRPFTGRDADQIQSARAALWRRWVMAFTLGELIGFGGIPTIGAAIVLASTRELASDLRSLSLFAVSVLGGAGEGAVLAWFQLRVLRSRFPAVSAGRWIGATAVAAAGAWACGMLAPTLDDLVGLSPAAQIAIWVPAGLLILLSIGCAQAWALRGVARRPARWVVANAVGWLAALPWTFVLPGLLPAATPLAGWIVTFVAAGVLMGLTAGAVTGWFLVRLEPAAFRGSGAR